MPSCSLLNEAIQNDMFDTLDELLGPLSARIMDVLAQPVAGTDDQLQHNDTKRAYLALLNTIMQSGLHSVFLSERTYICTLPQKCLDGEVGR
jgi:exportin-T